MTSTIKIHPSRYEHLKSEFKQPYFSQIKDFLVSEKQAGKTIYPAGSNIFKAFDLTPWDEVKVVILGQDPYHGPEQAMGLSFSVPKELPLPPSLRNIYKELELEGYLSHLEKGIKGDQNSHTGSLLTHLAKMGEQSGDLTRRAGQGILLLNSILTVRAGEAASHSKIGRQHFTDAVIRQIAMKKNRVVFMLRGNYAIGKKQIIVNSRASRSLPNVRDGHPSPNEGRRGNEGEADFGLILTGAHPSPLSASRGRFGCNHFKLCNEYLLSQGEKIIER